MGTAPLCAVAVADAAAAVVLLQVTLEGRTVVAIAESVRSAHCHQRRSILNPLHVSAQKTNLVKESVPAIKGELKGNVGPVRYTAHVCRPEVDGNTKDARICLLEKWFDERGREIVEG
jgi:hypothetical protein